MRVFSSKIKNGLYLIYRIVSPYLDIFNTIKSILATPRSVADITKYHLLNKNRSFKISFFNLFPQLQDKTITTTIDSHYYYQQIWALSKIYKYKPCNHIDIGSQVSLGGVLSITTPTEFVDIRPFDPKLPHLKAINGDICNLPYNDNAVESLSSLHVIEHIGLGRYGDQINPEGHILAAKELSRVLKDGGKLYISAPLGEDRLCFNAHRVISVKTMKKIFNRLRLISFSYVDDKGEYYTNVDHKRISKCNYGCGMYEFTKK